MGSALIGRRRVALRGVEAGLLPRGNLPWLPLALSSNLFPLFIAWVVFVFSFLGELLPLFLLFVRPPSAVC
jgi:hypothetical protein